MAEVVKFSFDKATAMKLARKAISNKMAILSVNDSIIKAGTPPLMVVKLTFSDHSVEFSGSPMLLGTAKSAIELEYEDYCSGGSAPAPAAQDQATHAVDPAPQAIDPEKYLEYQDKVIELLKKYKDLLKDEIISQEEYDAKKAELLNFMKGMARK